MKRRMNFRSTLMGGGTAKIAVFASFILLLALLSSCRQVTVVLPPDYSGEITVSGAPEGNLEEGDSFQLEIETGAPDSKVTWVSSDPDVATVSPDGVVTAVGPGEAEITAQYKDKVSEPVKVVVSGIAVESGFGTALSAGTSNKTITLKAYGDAKISDIAKEPTINPSSGSLTRIENPDGSISYTIDPSSLSAGTEYTIDFGGNPKSFTFTYVTEEVTVDVDGKDVVTGIEPNKETVIDISSELKDDEEIAKITTDDGTVIYDVNNPEKTGEGYEYNPDNKTLTVPAGIEDKLTINAEKVKVLLFDALLTTNGRNYTRPTLNADNLKGKYSKPSEAYDAVSNLKFNRGIYIQLQSDFEKESLELKNIQKPVTIDLNKHSWAKGNPETAPGKAEYDRIIRANVNPGVYINIIDGTLCDNNLTQGSDILGAALFVNSSASGTIANWCDGKRSTWTTANIYDVTFSGNYADGGGAICLNGAVELNVFNSKFNGNKSLSTKQGSETGCGTAIYVWSANSGIGEVVNLYDCTFSGNDGDGLLSVEKNNTETLFNIFGGDFTGNTLYTAPLMSIYSFNIYGGNFNNSKLSNDSGNNNKMVINGGIMGTLEINGDNPLTLAGGSVGTLTNDKDTDKVCASVTLGTANKVEYVTYEGGTVNINSPFKIDRNGDVHYKFENGYDRISGDEFNGSEFNPEIRTFNDRITVHFADGTTVDLNKTETEGSVEFK